MERRGVLATGPPERKLNFLHIPKTGGTGLELLSKARQIYREDYLLYERLRKMDVRARVDPHAIADDVHTQVETVVGASVVGTIYIVTKYVTA